MRPLFFVLLFLLSNLASVAQKESNIWYFGVNAGLTFNGGAPTALTNGALNTTEGCASVADKNGNILFYTDGRKVWNKIHQQMPNGFGLKGTVSTTQCVIVPQPGSKTIYYIFTVDDLAEVDGLCYSIVDMSLQFGKGDITQKNIFLAGSMTEKLTATLHNNTCDIWLVVHEWNTDAFYSYKITSSGLDTNKVVSHCGIPHNGIRYSAMGCMKISPAGDKLALAQTYSQKTYEICDFDNSTGIVSNAITFPNNAYDQAYGIEFSPDGSKVYATQNAAGIFRLWQIDLSSGNAATIISSIQQVGTSSEFLMSMQLGPDNKIYVSTSTATSLGVIQSPNLLGNACNYVDNGVSLSGRITYSGLPQKIIVAQFPYAIANTSPNVTIPLGTSTTLSASGGTTYEWSPSSGLSCTNCAQPIATPSTKTVYTVIVSNANGCSSIDSVTIDVEIVCDNLYIPNAFSPNGDGENDTYKIKGNCMEKFSLSIYDRWGNQVFETTNINEGWDGNYKGEPMNTGAYCYRAIIYSQSGKYIERAGTLSLIK